MRSSQLTLGRRIDNKHDKESQQELHFDWCLLTTVTNPDTLYLLKLNINLRYTGVLVLDVYIVIQLSFVCLAYKLHKTQVNFTTVYSVQHVLLYIVSSFILDWDGWGVNRLVKIVYLQSINTCEIEYVQGILKSYSVWLIKWMENF
jgi:hypothetical protein